MLSTILEDLKGRFGEKVILTPEDIAPIIATSPAVQANLRSQGRFPIPVKKMGKKVGVTIYHLAEFLATGDVAVEVVKPDTRQSTTQRIIKNRDWLVAFQAQNQFCFELHTRIEKILLEDNLTSSSTENRVRKV